LAETQRLLVKLDDEEIVFHTDDLSLEILSLGKLASCPM
jgi:hypothetical protein